MKGRNNLDKKFLDFISVLQTRLPLTQAQVFKPLNAFLKLFCFERLTIYVLFSSFKKSSQSTLQPNKTSHLSCSLVPPTSFQMTVLSFSSCSRFPETTPSLIWFTALCSVKTYENICSGYSSKEKYVLKRNFRIKLPTSPKFSEHRSGSLIIRKFACRLPQV